MNLLHVVPRSAAIGGRRLHSIAAGLPWVWLLAAALSLLLTGLALAYPLGLGLDYPNHLARTYIEGWIWVSEDLQRYYDLSLTLVPDLTMDLVVPWLSHLIGIYPAGAVTIAAALVCAPLAGLLISSHLNGGRPAFFSLFGFLAAFNINMQWGFVNFAASGGFALLAFALWMRCAPGARRSAVFALIGLALVANHALAFLFFGYIALLWEVASFVEGRRGRWPQFVRGLLLRDAPAMAPALAMLAAAVGTAQGPLSYDTWAFPIEKFFTLLSTFEFFNAPLAWSLFLLLTAGFVLGLHRRLLSMRRDIAIVCLGLLALVLVMPTNAFGIWGLHFRYPWLCFVVIAASCTVSLPSRAGSAALAAVACVMLAAQANSAAYWMSHYDRVADSLRAAFSRMEPGARLLSAASPGADRVVALHGANLAVIERDAFVHGLFTNTSWVDVVPDMLPQHRPQAAPPTPDQLAAARCRALPPAANGQWSEHYHFGWPEHWDYLVHFHAAEAEPWEDPALRPVARGAGFTLFEIAEGAAATCS